MKKYLFILGITFYSIASIAQPFANEIADFKKQDSVAPPPKHAILFVGSSSFRMWSDVAQYFPGYPIINRGFGGSALPDVIRYADDIIFPYSLKQVVIYCGENDIAASDTVTAQLVLQRFTTLFNMIRNKMPGVPILFVSIKPSPSRWQMKDRMIAANELIKKYIQKQDKARYINVWNAMLGPDGKPLPHIFIADNLHMNAQGYKIWQKIIAPYLAK
jgi:lysophospholipase L1-like esterase